MIDLTGKRVWLNQSRLFLNFDDIKEMQLRKDIDGNDIFMIERINGCSFSIHRFNDVIDLKNYLHIEY